MRDSVPLFTQVLVRRLSRFCLISTILYGTASAADPTAPEEPVSDPAWAEQMPVEAARGRFKLGDGLQSVSKDGQFAMATRLRAQFRYTLTDSEGSELQHLFHIRRARLAFSGHMFGQHNKFKAEFAFSPSDENVGGIGDRLTNLLDWYGEFDHIRDLTLRVGQYKVPFSRQRVVSSGDLQMVDRSVAQGEFQLDRDMGLHLFSRDLAGLDMFRYYAGLWMNQGRDAHQLDPFRMMYIARVEVLPLGLFDDYSEGDFVRHATPKLSVGAAYAYLDEAQLNRGILGTFPRDGGTTDLHVFTADGILKWAGLSVLGEFFYRQGYRDGGGLLDAGGELLPIEPARDAMGWTAQAGYLFPLPEALEFSARYSELVFADRAGLDPKRELGAGLSWYEAEHSFKVQIDYFRLWSESFGEGGSNQMRVQLQLAY